MINRFNWKIIWEWAKLPFFVVALILAGWWIYGCRLIPVATDTVIPSASQSLIDEEVERISGWNEALRKLKAAGCSCGPHFTWSTNIPTATA